MSKLPSARHLAFKKNVWHELGGFDETLPFAGEDTEFVMRLTSRYGMCEHTLAVVYWRPPKNFIEMKNKVESYSEGEARSGVMRVRYCLKACSLIMPLDLIVKKPLQFVVRYKLRYISVIAYYKTVLRLQ